MYDRLAYYKKDDSLLAENIVTEYEELVGVMEMIDELDRVNAYDINAEFTKNEQVLRETILQIMIAKRLDFSGVVEYMVNVIDEFFEVQEKELNDLKKQIKHRHKTILGLYTERAVY